ncbi:hypothetical protein EOD41_07860 [Mucilaginibacter limnophilus]|uniref:BIG2 domain-containing protein n=1 Tax=Mucilaginibacter limnophilus TaxID=1932778 RepID=A0A437MW51_9SPHI|nr:LamG-like jellyroll fold domain-containing protein [Mucilaginibacter limnophilus]RVU01863.1 hypothetical protein EOD41_07860 [Mucilaginibacter limnophilus]
MKKLLFLAMLAFAALSSCSKVFDETSHRNLLEGIYIDSASLHMVVGEQRQIPMVTNPSTFPLDSLKLYSSDISVLTISNTGLLTALREGQSTITVSDLDSTTSVSVQVTVSKATPDSLTVGLVAFYPLNNDSAADSSGNGHNGTAFDLISTTDRHNTPDAAYQFNGQTSHIVIDDSQALRLSNTDFTLNMWVKVDSYIAASGSSLLSKNTGAFQQGWNCSIVGTDNHDGAYAGNLFYNVSGGPDPFAVGNVVIGTEGWHMLTITYELEKQQISLYIDGILDSYVRSIPTPNPNTAAKLHIGDNSLLDVDPWANAYNFHGKLDDISIYNRKLTVTEIKKLSEL